MRVIAGLAGRVPLAVAPGTSTRPLLEKARGGLANALAPRIPGARVLDLYAGSGALGIELLSRGAGLAVFVERDPAAAEALRENLRRTGLGARALVLVQSVGEALARLSRAGLRTRPSSGSGGGDAAASERAAPPPVEPARFDLVFLDPPFAQAADWAEDPEGRRVTAALPGRLAEGGVLLFRFEERRAPPLAWPGLAAVRDQHYGRSRVVWYAAESAVAP